MMKNKRNMIVAGLTLLLVGLAWFLLPTDEAVEKTSIVKAEQSKVSQQDPEKKAVAKNITEYMKSPDADSVVLKRIKKVQKFQSLKTAEFSYYGKVIDQHGDPVVGASVQVDIGYYPFIPNGNFYPSHKILSLVTDAEGRFSVVGEKGESVSIDLVEKSGYEIHYWFPPLTSFTFSRVGLKGLKKVSNPDKPVIFHAWKKTESEPLYYGEYKQKFKNSGTFETINIPGLKNGLSVKFDLDPSGEPYKPENWNISIGANAGGVIESQGEVFMNEAPESGYMPVWSKAYEKGAEGFTDEARKKFYFRSGNNYGRMEVNYVAYYKKGVAGILRIKYWINPNGSRNLQDDPKKRIYPK